ncbi:MAG: 50S ribosomal protein L17 [Hyphomicrobiales bacterium]
MRHRVHGRHLGRDTAHRVALYRNLVTDLLRYERITTTEAKAKEIRPMAEKIITLGRRGDLHARRLAGRFVYDPKVVQKVFTDIGPRMRDRPGGYLRITALEARKGDGAKMASIELVDYVEAPPTPRPQRVTAAPATAPAATTAAPAEEPATVPAHTDVMDRMVDERENVAEAPAAEETQEPPEALPSDELAAGSAESALEAEEQAEAAEAKQAEEREASQGGEGDGSAGPVR